MLPLHEVEVWVGTGHQDKGLRFSHPPWGGVWDFWGVGTTDRIATCLCALAVSGLYLRSCTYEA